MANASASKGKRWERDLREGLRSARLDVEALRLRGTEDEGDMVVRLNGRKRLLIEAKNEARLDLARYVAEAIAEADNYAAHRKDSGVKRRDVTAVAVIKRRGKSWREAYVVTTLGEFCHLD